MTINFNILGSFMKHWIGSHTESDIYERVVWQGDGGGLSTTSEDLGFLCYWYRGWKSKTSCWWGMELTGPDQVNEQGQVPIIWATQPWQVKSMALQRIWDPSNVEEFAQAQSIPNESKTGLMRSETSGLGVMCGGEGHCGSQQGPLYTSCWPAHSSS